MAVQSVEEPGDIRGHDAHICVKGRGCTSFREDQLVPAVNTVANLVVLAVLRSIRAEKGFDQVIELRRGLHIRHVSHLRQHRCAGLRYALL